MATLLGQKINATYDSLLKTEDNDGITGSLKQLTDGVGQTTPLYLSTTEAKIGGNLEITGDLTVGGTTTYINTDNVTVKDGLVLLANDNVADIIDIGLYGKYNDGTVKYTGFYRDATDGKFKIFDGLTTEPTTTVGGGNLADFAAAGGSYSGNLIVDGNYYSTDGAISLTNGDIVTGGHIAINSGNAATSFSSNANQLIVGGADSGTNQGMTIASDSGATGNIFFADGIIGDQQYRGLITYNHSSDTMYLGTAAANRISIASDGTFTKLGSTGNITLNDGGYKIDFSQQGIIEASGVGAYLNLIADGVMGLYASQLSFSRDSGITTDFNIDSSGVVNVANLTASNAITSGTLNVADAIIHTGDTDTMIEFLANQIKTTTGGVLNINTTPTATTFYQNVGIGGTPATKLDVFSSGSALRLNSLDANGSYAIFANNGTAKGYMGSAYHLLSAPSNIATDLAIRAEENLIFAAGGSSEKMRIDSSGRVGIGVSPSAKLHSSDSTAAQGLFTGWSSVGANSASGAIRLGNNSTYQGRIDYAADGNTQFSLENTYSAGIMTFKTGGSERMRIDSSGNVGIGNSVASSFNQRVNAPHLVVGSGSNSAGVTIYSGTAAQGSINFADGTTTTEQYMGGILYVHGTDNYMAFNTNGSTERMRIDSSGNVTMYNNLYCSNIITNSGDLSIDSGGSGNNILFKYGGSERMRITSGGYLKASNTGTYSSATALFHEIRTNSANSYIARFDNTAATNSGFAGINIRYTSLSPDANSNSFLVCEDSTTVRMRVYSDGDVWTSDAGTLLSDETLKRDITDASPKLDDIMKLRVRNYYWREDYHPNKQDKKLIGFIAQEFEEVFPNMVSEHTIKDAEYETIEHPAVEATYEIIEHAEELDEEGNVIKEAWTEEIELTPAQDAWTETTDVLISEEVRKKGIKEGKLIPILVKAMQEQQDIINKLEARIAALEAR